MVAAIAIVFIIATATAFAETPVLSTPDVAPKVASGDLAVLDVQTSVRDFASKIAK